ncbi:FAD-dependent monooxygenase [Nocardia sp. NBC_01730]|uniref:NAD(P)/FAD-dependent oxidoreductase n=1 Tax=Nocardia sp. NBC_01730 TaxID=2975998 RepID=UPI002E150D9C|nr:FAD-dependent monooxygenase [Nocardia sp. NBC_01730]
MSITEAQGRGTAVVIGGGYAGLLAAWALRDTAERVVIIERDFYPARPEARPGVPQARHAHLMLEAGHRLLEEMMPGIRTELLGAGAVMVAMSGDLHWLTSAGWMAPHNSQLAILSCTRPVLDHVVRARISAESSVQFIEGAEVIGLLGTDTTVTGVQIRQRGGVGSVREIRAELVVDACGRSSKLTRWLSELGCAPVPEEHVDGGVAYASRLFHRPPDRNLGFSALYLQTRAPNKLRMGSLMPVENDRWIVSVGGMRGAEPPPGEHGFNTVLAQLRDPALSDALSTARPAGPVWGHRPGPSRRRHFECGTADGLVVVGDAACSVNPVYGQGMTIAALGAHALRAAALRHGGIGPATARAARRAVTAASKTAWLMSASEDRRFPATIGGPSGVLVDIQHRYLDQVLRAATTNPRVAAAFGEVMSLVAPPNSLLRPGLLAPVLLGVDRG